MRNNVKNMTHESLLSMIDVPSRSRHSTRENGMELVERSIAIDCGTPVSPC